jgi:glycosyltransferase involved in cell wall biosynthesis
MLQIERLNMPSPSLTTYGGIALTEFMKLTYLSRGDLRKRFSLDSQFERTAYLMWFLLNAKEFFGLSSYWLIEPSWELLNEPSPEYGQFEKAPLTNLQTALWFAQPLPKILDLNCANDRLKIEMTVCCWKYPEGIPNIKPSAAACTLAKQIEPTLENDTSRPITVLMYTLWLLRADLRAAFPLDTQESRQNLVNWFDIHGKTEHNLSIFEDGENQSCKPTNKVSGALVSDKSNVERSKKRLSFGMNIIGNAAGGSGMAKHAQTTLLAADYVGVPACIVDQETCDSDRASYRIPLDLVTNKSRYSINVAAHNIDSFPSYIARSGEHIGDCYNIYFGNWEYSDYPSRWQEIIKHFDEIWAPSQFTLKTMSSVFKQPVTYIPLSVTVSPGYIHKRKFFNLPEDTFLFLFTFDYWSWLERKNPIACVKAFKLAFPKETEPVGLVIKVKNIHSFHPQASEQWVELLKLAESDKRITIIDEIYHDNVLHDLVRECDAYISLHRAEGFGLAIAEAMLLGKPVIATNYSGNTDFTKDDNSCPVNYELISLAEPHAEFLGIQTKWADPDIEHAAWFMQRMYEDSTYGKKLGQAGQDFIKTHYNLQTIGEQIKNRLLHIEGSFLRAENADNKNKQRSDSLIPNGTYTKPGLKSKFKHQIRKIALACKSQTTGIDAVYTWVNGADPLFKDEFNKYYATQDNKNDSRDSKKNRFRDNEELRYSLRSLEFNAPWINRIFIVTNGQVPHWLNLNHPRLRLVTHAEIFPNKTHLPTFNSLAIETHLHRIKGLSRRFLYFNDDMFLGRLTSREDFISAEGIPKIRVEKWILPDSQELNDLTFKWLSFNHKLLKNRYGNRGFVMFAHAPCLYDKKSIAAVQKIWKEEFAKGSSMRFRTKDSAALYVLYPHVDAIRNRLELVVEPSDNYAFVMIKEPLERSIQALSRIKRDRPQFFTINDDWYGAGEDKDIVLRHFLNDYFPNPCSFEKQ